MLCHLLLRGVGTAHVLGKEELLVQCSRSPVSDRFVNKHPFSCKAWLTSACELKEERSSVLIKGVSDVGKTGL